MKFSLDDTHVGFRPWRRDDYHDLAKNINNINIWNSVRDYLPYPYTQQDAIIFISHAMESDPINDYAITINDIAVGGIGIIPQSDVNRLSAEIGYWLAEEHWNKGIMSRIVAMFTNHIFQTREIIHLYAHIFGNNPASHRTIEKAGYTKVGIYHRAAIKNNQIIDLCLYEMCKTDSE